MLSIFSTRETGGFGSNLLFAVVAQGVGLFSSILTSLILPKLLGVEEYAYWQLFLLYSSYAGFALLGLNDGIYLRLGGKRYDDLDHGALKGQQFIVLLSQVVVAIVCLGVAAASGLDSDRTAVFVFVVIFGLAANMTQCLRYVFQCTNLTRISSLADLASKGLFIVFVCTLFLVGLDRFLPFVVCYTVCQFLALCYVFVCARKVIFAPLKLRGALATFVSDVKSGMKIMVAYYADSLVVGFTRMLIDARLGLMVFGKLSLSFSLTNFVLTFIGQVGMVAFPVLKRLDPSQQREKYAYIRRTLHIILPVVYLAYVPIRYILVLWLPDYAESFVYLALTMPLCVYSCKANLLFNTYMKIGRYETRLCIINVATMVLNGFLSYVLIDVFGVVGATVGIIASVTVRDWLFEHFMDEQFHLGHTRQCVFQALMTAGFMLVSWYLGAWSILAVASMLAVFWGTQSKDFILVVKGLASRLPLGSR